MDYLQNTNTAEGGSSPEADTSDCTPNSHTPLLDYSQDSGFVRSGNVIPLNLPSQNPFSSRLAQWLSPGRSYFISGTLLKCRHGSQALCSFGLPPSPSLNIEAKSGGSHPFRPWGLKSQGENEEQEASHRHRWCMDCPFPGFPLHKTSPSCVGFSLIHSWAQSLLHALIPQASPHTPPF